MLNFEYYSPTKIIFGRDMEKRAGEEIRKLGCKKVLVHYGSASAKKSGLLDRVFQSLEEAAGVPALSVVSTGNPAPELYRLCRREIRYDHDLLVKGLYLLYRKNARV